MSQNKITMTIKPAENKKNPTIDGMIALKKIEHYTYALSDEIGLGFSSHVYRGKNEHTNEPVAIKVIDLKKEDELSRQFMNDEINILEMIKNRSPANLLKLYDVFKTKNNLYIITEFCEGKDVAKVLRKKKRFSQMEAQSILKQLMNAYRELYELSIVHRDLKLANVFVKQGIIKLADFGFAIDSDKCGEKFDYNVGSPYYMPPEALKFNRYSFKSDVWSFGIIAYEMVYGHLPWKEKIQSVLFQKITTTPIDDLLEPDVQLSDHYKHFIRSCLQIDYDRRANPEFIIGYQWPLSQEYVEGIDPDNQQNFKSMSIVRVPSADNYQNPKPYTSTRIREQRRDGNTFGQPFQERDRSPVHRTDHVISNPFDNPPHQQERHRTVFQQVSRPPSNKPMDMFQSVDSITRRPTELNPPSRQVTPGEASSNAETCILSQIYYCRFLSNLLDFIEENSSIREAYLLKSEIINKIHSKIQGLMKLREGDNNLQIEGFNFYKSSEKWVRLKDIIFKFSERYKDKYPLEFKSENHDQTLLNAIKSLRGNIPGYFNLLEELTYFYQLKDLQKRQNIRQFALNSKLQLLSSRKPQKQQNLNPTLFERLNNRLVLLGF